MVSPSLPALISDCFAVTRGHFAVLFLCLFFNCWIFQGMNVWVFQNWWGPSYHRIPARHSMLSPWSVLNSVLLSSCLWHNSHNPLTDGISCPCLTQTVWEQGTSSPAFFHGATWKRQIASFEFSYLPVTPGHWGRRRQDMNDESIIQGHKGMNRGNKEGTDLYSIRWSPIKCIPIFF